MSDHTAIKNKPKCARDHRQGRDHVKKLTVGQLRIMLKFEFNSTAANGKKKDECVDAVMMRPDAINSLAEV
jgi:hypothetical protein